MKKSLIDRINELARKAKTVGLTEEEKIEQKRLREKYIQDFKQGMINALERIVFVDADGNYTKLRKLDTPEQ
ncbi:MAG: DUF896 domain-containing protein [Clostridiaceae bacterium]|nr:DUF896 domain-containing protein [Clostridiaceae bacterium]